MVLALDSRAMWYLTRSTGFVALVLLTVSVVLGIAQATRWSSTGWPRFIVTALHKNASLLVTVFLAVHITTAVVDGFAPIRWLDVVIPFASAYRPLWLGLGAVAVDLLIALIITSLLRGRLGYRAWRAVHWAAYACWPVALVHGLGTGSDNRRTWALALDAASLIAVAGAAWWRLARTPAPERRRPALLWAVSLAVPALVVAWAYAGPLQRGWARRAGTPAALLGTPQPVADQTAAPADGGGTDPSQQSSDTAPLKVPFTADFSGTVQQTSGGASGTTITIAGNLSGGTSAPMKLVLSGPAAPGGGVQLQSSQVTIGANDELQGQVVRLEGGTLLALLDDGSGTQVTAAIRLQIDGSNARGRVDVRAGGSRRGSDGDGPDEGRGSGEG